MFKLLVVLFIIKLYARTNIFKHVKKKHGQVTLLVIRKIKDQRTRLMKTKADIQFIKTCKRENITPTFAKVKLSIKNGNRKLQSRITKLVMQTELQAKHRTKKKITREIKLLNNQLKRTVNIIIFMQWFTKLMLLLKAV